MASVDECKLPDGSTDWNKYQELQKEELEARKAKGEVCQRNGCNRHVMFSSGIPGTCSECLALDDPDELHHSGEIRCPKCGHHREIGDDGELYAEGTHEVTCSKCNFEFEIETWISFTFVSPERITESEEEAK